MSKEEESLLFNFLTQKCPLDHKDVQQLSSFITTTPKTASKILGEACAQLASHTKAPEEIATTLGNLAENLVDLLERGGKFWYQNVREIKTMLLGIDRHLLPTLFRVSLDDIKNGELVKALVKELSDGEIAKVIIESLRLGDSMDDVRALSLFLAHSVEKRKTIYPVLLKKMEEEQIPSEMVQKVTEDPLWSEISFSDKAYSLLKKNTIDINQVEDIRAVLKELLVQKETEKIELLTNNILTQLASASGKVRAKAIDMLSEILDIFQSYQLPAEMSDKIVRLINERLEDHEIDVRFHALDVISNYGTKDSLPFLLNVARKKSGFASHVDDEMRKKAIFALGNIGDQNATPELRKLVLSKSFMTVLENTDIRLCAVQALSKIGGDEAKKILQAVAEKDGRESVRDEAKRGLAKVDEDNW